MSTVAQDIRRNLHGLERKKRKRESSLSSFKIPRLSDKSREHREKLLSSSVSKPSTHSNHPYKYSKHQDRHSSSSSSHRASSTSLPSREIPTTNHSHHEEDTTPSVPSHQQQARVFLVPTTIPPPPPQPQPPVYVEIPRTLSGPDSQEVDIFPTLSYDDVPRFDLDMPSSPNGIRSFINVLKSHRVYFHVVDSKAWTLNIERHYDQSQQCQPILFDKLDWARIEKRLSLRPTSDRLNEDLRLVHRWDNVYLTKTYFTFGQRTPDVNTCHIVQTSAAPLLYYQLDLSHKTRFSQHRDDIRRRKKRFSRTVIEQSTGDVSPKCFSSYDQYLYERYVLQPFSIYKIPAGTSYVLITYQKTLFRMDVVPEMMADSMEARGVYRFASPTADRNPKPNSSKGYCVAYNIPPPTPIAVPSTLEPQQDQQLQEQYRVSEEEQMLEELFGSFERLQQPQPTPDATPDATIATDGQVLLGDQQQQFTVYFQPPETRDAEVNTDSSLLQCSKCSSDSATTVLSTRGLGIAKKRISSCKSTKEQSKQQPLDLCCGGGDQHLSEQTTLQPHNLPPAPQKVFEDSGVFQLDYSSDESSSDEEEMASSDDDEMPAKEPTSKEAHGEAVITDAAVASITSDDMFWKSL